MSEERRPSEKGGYTHRINNHFLTAYSSLIIVCLTEKWAKDKYLRRIYFEACSLTKIENEKYI
jgi:hypothetical protein